jgi:phosphoglycolate phosphatase
MYIIFDLDGTISDSSPGIFQTFRLLFERYDLPLPSQETLKTYIGPPIEETLEKHFPHEEVKKAADLYRKLYKDAGGIYKNNMYKGMDKLLRRLKEEGNKIYLATTKEVNLAKDVLNNFGILGYFDGVYGVDPPRNIYTKLDVLNQLFSTHDIDKERCVLVGDTIYDVNGARHAGIKIGIVLYSFSKKKDFEGMEIDFFVQSVEEIYPSIKKVLRK